MLVPAYLATIPHHLSMDSPAPLRESEAAVPLLELIEQRVTRRGAGAASGARYGARPVRRGHLTARRSAARAAGWVDRRNSGFRKADW